METMDLQKKWKIDVKDSLPYKILMINNLIVIMAPNRQTL